jgi:hypothetical protein
MMIQMLQILNRSLVISATGVYFPAVFSIPSADELHQYARMREQAIVSGTGVTALHSGYTG